MQAALFKVVALIAAAVLALPPGICCGMIGPAAQNAPATGTCCHQASTPSPDQHQPPTRPESNCCCTVRAATTSSTVQAPESAAPGFFVAAMMTVPPAIDPGRTTAPAIVPTGPPLRILHCVWRI